jgi:hypothetical protein
MAEGITMRKIESIEELRLECARLTALKTEQEYILKNDVEAIVERLKPINLLMNLSSDLFARRKEKGIIDGALNLGLYILTNKFLGGGTPGIIKSVLTYVGQNVAANLITSKSETLFDKVKGLFKKKVNKEAGLFGADHAFEKHHKFN